MLPWNDWRSRRDGRARSRPDLAASVEPLDRRELLSYTPLGHALPDLTITGYASSSGSWGKPLGVTIDLKNIASESQVEPLSVAPGSVSQADAGPSRVAVFASRSPVWGYQAVRVGTFDVPGVPQNSDLHFTTTITLPNRPHGLPGDGGHVYLFFVANADKNVPETDLTNNISNSSLLQIVAPFPELTVVGLDVPPVIQPGDTIQPNIRVANFGPVDTAAQGPVTVALVASVTPSFGPGSSILGLYTIANIPGVDSSPTKVPVYSNATVSGSGSNNINTDINTAVPNNIVEINGPPVTLPTTPSVYFIGVVVDPFNKIKQIQQIGGFRAKSNNFALSRQVGPPIIGLPPAGVQPPGFVFTGSVFPFPATGVAIGSPGTVTATTTTTTPTTTIPNFPIFRTSIRSLSVGQPLSGTVFGTGVAGARTSLVRLKPGLVRYSSGTP